MKGVEGYNYDIKVMENNFYLMGSNSEECKIFKINISQL